MPQEKYPDASPQEIDEAMIRAWACFPCFRKQPGKERGKLLRAIAKHLTKEKKRLVLIAEAETSLGHDRLEFELKRTIAELVLFADLAENGKWKEHREEKAEPDRKPIPKPGMHTENVPIGPVIVVGACNFPFAISVVGTIPHWQSDVRSWSKRIQIVRTCQSLVLLKNLERNRYAHTSISTCPRDQTLGNTSLG